MIVPIKVLITDSKLLDHPDIKEQLDKLQKAGHDITVDDSFSQYDFITGPNCWLLRPEVAGLFTLAITNARKIANADEERKALYENQKRSNKITVAKARKRTTTPQRTARQRNSKVTPTTQLEEQSSFLTESTDPIVHIA